MDNQGRSFLHTAALEKKPPEKLAFLLNHKNLEIEQLDKGGQSALDLYFLVDLEDHELKGNRLLRPVIESMRDCTTFVNRLDLPADQKGRLREIAEKNPAALADPANQEMILTGITTRLAKRIQTQCSTLRDPSLLKQCDDILNSYPRVKDVSLLDPAKLKALNNKRMEKSDTLTSASPEAVKAQGDWLEMDIFVRELAISKTMLTKEHLKKINLVCNTKSHPGELRQKSNDVSSVSGDYVSGHMVEKQVDEFFAWLDDALHQCDENKANPIQVAASVYQRLVSIHPFNDANGRTSRMVMDYVLQRYGLPPVGLNDVNLAIYGVPIREGLPESSDQAVLQMMQGLENTYRLLGIDKEQNGTI